MNAQPWSTSMFVWCVDWLSLPILQNMPINWFFHPGMKCSGEAHCWLVPVLRCTTTIYRLSIATKDSWICWNSCSQEYIISCRPSYGSWFIRFGSVVQALWGYFLILTFFLGVASDENEDSDFFPIFWYEDSARSLLLLKSTIKLW